MLDQYFKLGCDCLMFLCYQIIFHCHSIIWGYETWVAKSVVMWNKSKKCEYDQIWSQKGSNITDLSTVFPRKIADSTLLRHDTFSLCSLNIYTAKKGRFRWNLYMFSDLIFTFCHFLDDKPFPKMFIIWTMWVYCTDTNLESLETDFSLYLKTTFQLRAFRKSWKHEEKKRLFLVPESIGSSWIKNYKNCTDVDRNNGVTLIY
jgi:hypothetical protein